MKRVLISRTLGPEAPFRQLQKYGIEIVDESFLEFEGLPFTIKNEFDWVFFYSQNGMRFFFEKQVITRKTKYAVMGMASARFFEKLHGFPPDFVGSGGSPENIAEEFHRLIGNDTVLFIKANNSRDSIRKLIDSSKHEALSVYQNSKREVRLESGFDMLVFTSPLNASSYFDQYDYNGETLLAIGPSTANYLQKNYGLVATFPDKSSEEELLKLAAQKLNIKI